MKKVLGVIISAVLTLVLGALIGYGIVTYILPGMTEPETEDESVPTVNVYQRTGESERELTPANLWLHRQYIMTIPKPDPTPTPIPAQVAAIEDFSPEASAVTDSSGYLNVPDNATVEDVNVRKLKTKYFSLLMPGAWVNNVVIECKYINEITESGEGENAPVYDTLLLRFFEKRSFLESKEKEGRNSFESGLLTELRYSSTANDNSWLKTSNYQNYWADVKLGVRTYNVFIYEPNSQADLIRDALRDRYLYMLNLNYEGCFINTFKVNGDGKVTYADEYIIKGFVDSWDPNAEGLSDGSVIPPEYE